MKDIVLRLMLMMFTPAVRAYRDLTPLETYHMPALGTKPRPSKLPGTGGATVPPKFISPDFRDDDPYILPPKYWGWVAEENRPYRITPFMRVAYHYYSRLWYTYDNPWLLGCYCTVAYRRLTPLAGCAVLTVRHILTTAWPTYIILTRHKNAKRMVNLLGWWYNTDTWDRYANDTRYMTPARIHFHPRWSPPETSNASHPFPVTYDLAVYTSLFPIKWSVFICRRGGPNHKYTSSKWVYNKWTVYIMVASQFIRAYKRNPTVHHRYAVRASINWFMDCPKVEWGWFHCVTGRWKPLGLDSGVALHRDTRDGEWAHFHGLIGMNTISMKLRSQNIVSYFTLLNSHPVLNFLYDSYMGQVKPAFLDEHYGDVQWGQLTPYEKYYIPWINDEPQPKEYHMGFYHDWQTFYDGKK